MDRITRQKRVGEVKARGNVEDVSEEVGEGGGALLMYDKPDVTRDPQTGGVVPVLDVFQPDEPMTCPKCGGQSKLPVIVAACDGKPDKVWVVMQCPSCNQFVWKQLPKFSEKSKGD